MLVDFRLGNASGSQVPFTTTFSSNKITVIPTVALIPNQTYYLALKPNMVEDTSDNAVTAVTSTTLPPQEPQFLWIKILLKSMKMQEL
jgi:hypothetical protein